MGSWCCTCLLPVLFLFPVILADTYAEDAAALISLSDSWKNKPFNWIGSNPCDSHWVGINCTNSRITSITLSSIGLEGTISGDIQSLTELQTLDLSYNQGLTGNLPPSIGNLTKLETLSLVGCRFFGEIPDLGSLQQLTSLYLNSNQFSGRIHPSIGRLSKLFVLDITDNMLTGSIPVSSGNSPGLDWLIQARHFHFGRNHLSGTIPEKLFRSDMQLIHVLFDNNNLDGNIPSTLGLVKTLEVVRLDGNLLEGPVPTNINNLTSVQELYLSHNKLTGPLPNLTGMNALRYVNLSNNSFDRSDAPPWFSTLQSLTTLVMEYLNAENSIPPALFTHPQLVTIRLRSNNFGGILDFGSNYSRHLQLVDLQNNKIEDVVGEYENQLILVGNPFCYHRGSSDPHCTIQPQSYDQCSTPSGYCQQTSCFPDQKLSPNCKCAYPYTGTLFFRAPSFSDLGNCTNYQALEKKLLIFFQSNGLPVDSVALLGAAFNSDSYLQIELQIFPAGTPGFIPADISRIGLFLSNQGFLAQNLAGSFYFIGQVYRAIPGTMSNSKSKKLLEIIGVSIGVFILALMILLLAYAIQQKRNARRVVERSQPFASWGRTQGSGDVPQIQGPRGYPFDELKKSTNNFSELNEIGTGGYGKVYRGMLATGQLVAIKRAQQGSMQGGLEFKTEIELLSRVHHKNIVALVGFCFHRGEQMLVYEYVPNGTLRDSLSGKSGIHLDWRRRLQIALGAARGLAYLHELADPPIIHRDIKSNNILLDDRLNAKVADFGLCKPLSDDQKDHITTQVKGTMGYLDPEYCTTEQLTGKSDVYSFGVLLLELITGRRPIEKGRYIVREVRDSIDRRRDLYGLRELVDPSIGLGPFTHETLQSIGTSLSGLEMFVDLAMKCVEESGMARPAMGQVVKEIEGIMLLAGMNPNAESVHSSTSYETTSGGHHMGPYSKDSFDSGITSSVASSQVESK